jgi:uncharacterized repeat protein (TIGR01451 family)
VVSPVDGLWVGSWGFEEQEWFTNQDVPQGKHPDEFPPPDLMDGWVYTFEANDIHAIELSTDGPWRSDIDLYLLFDANGDGLFNIYDNREWIAYSDYDGPYEHIWYSGDFDSGGQVQDGTYAVVMYGYEVYEGDQFNLKLWTVGGNNLQVEGVEDDRLVTEAGVPTTLTVDWEVDGPGVWVGGIWFVMPREDVPDWSMGPEIWVPVIIDKEGTAFSIEKDVSQEMVEFGDILTYTITVENAGATQVWMEVKDVLPEGLDLIDGSLTSWLNETLMDGDMEDSFYYCELWYDDWMRTVGWSCELPFEYDGEVYTQDVITFRARVEAQPGDRLLNKADLWWYYDEGYGGALWDTAYSYVPLQTYLPLIVR